MANDKIINYIVSLCDKYSVDSETNKNNPFRDNLYIKIDNKYLLIPQHIKNQAYDIWNKKSIKKNVDINDNNNETYWTILLNILLYIFVIIVSLYTLSLLRKIFILF